jgi:hypothetical protein
MPKGDRSFLRANAFLVAAAALPLVVVGLFLLAAALPRWTVAPPAYDLLIRATGTYDRTPPRVAVDFNVRDGRVEAIVRAVAPDTYAPPSTLLLFDHQTSQVRTIPFEIPDVSTSSSPVTVPVEALRNVRVLAQLVAPDGYTFESRINRGPGIIGDLFGMNRYDPRAALVKSGRVLPIQGLASTVYHMPLQALGWVVNDGHH